MVEVSVCIGSSCHLKGSYNVIQAFQQMIEATFCMRQCSCSGVAVSVNGQVYSVMPDTAREFFSTTILPLVQ